MCVLVCFLEEIEETHKKTFEITRPLTVLYNMRTTKTIIYFYVVSPKTQCRIEFNDDDYYPLLTSASLKP